MKLPASLQHALAFIEKLPDDLPFPELRAAGNGDYPLEWYHERRLSIRVSVNKDGGMAYSWMLGDVTGHGVIRPGGDASPLIAKIREIVK